jgi:hypothetical protein
MKEKRPKIYNPSWANYAEIWKKVQPPWRPNKNDINFCEKMIEMVLKSEKKPKALVFGSTPEIRDLLAKYKIKTTLVDANPSMKKAMDSLMKRKNKKEKVIFSNWLNVKLPLNYFDLVFGDGILCNIALGTWKELIFKINNSLKENGLFYLAAWVYQIKKPWKFEELIEKYKKDPKYFKDFKNRIWSLHRLMYEPRLYDRKKKEYDFFKVMKKLRGYVRKHNLTNADFNKLQWTQPSLGAYVEIAFDSVKENDDILRKYYKIVDIFSDKSHPIMAFRRDYILRKKTMIISGKVIQGKQRGLSLGFPTVNLELKREIESGVYAGKVMVGNQKYKAGIFISPNKKVLEAHILNFCGDLYSKVIEVEIGEKIRDVMKFESDADLIEQIKMDISIILNS